MIDLYNVKIESDTLFDFAENTDCIGDSVQCVLNIVEAISGLRKKTDEFNNKLSGFAENGFSDKDPRVKASIKGLGKDLNICSKRLGNEIELFSELYSEGFYAYEQVILYHYLITKEKKSLEAAFASLEGIPKSVNEAISGITIMRNGVSKLPNKFAILKEAKKTLIQVIDVIIEEFLESKKMADELSEKVMIEK